MRAPRKTAPASSPKTPPVELIVIGGSAGVVEALNRILPALPSGFPVPLLVVVHLPPDRENTLVSLFAHRCRLPVKEAEDKEEIRPGTIYFAPSNYHLLVEPDGRLSLSSEEPVLFSRPSIDVLFESAADAYGSGVLGVILTGANSDGADGLAAVCRAGGSAVVQDPATAEMDMMPEAALTVCPLAKVMSLDEIVVYLQTVSGVRRG